MLTRPGIPKLDDVEQLLTSDHFAQHRSFNAAFLSRHGPLLARYGRWWGRDPLGLWSRRWEYPFVAERALDLASGRPGERISMLDAGSGITYLPSFLCERAANLSVRCLDMNPAYAPVIEQVAADRSAGAGRVTGRTGSLQRIDAADGEYDVVSCVSVLEHTSHHAQIVDELARVLKPGGSLILTFDISLDGKFQLQPADARRLIARICQYIDVSMDVEAEFAKLQDLTGLLTTDHCRRHAPHLLPFTHPWVLAAYDLVRGYGWTGGFRSVAVMCLCGLRKPTV